MFVFQGIKDTNGPHRGIRGGSSPSRHTSLVHGYYAAEWHSNGNSFWLLAEFNAKLNDTKAICIDSSKQQRFHLYI